MRMRWRDYRATLLVAALSGAFGALLLQGTVLLTDLVAGGSVGSKESTRLALGLVAVVFFAIAIFVGGIVTANTVGTVIAGRTRDIALLRLVGADARTLRNRIAVDGILVGLAGALIGTVVGIGLMAALIGVGVSTGDIPSGGSTVVSPALVAPVVVVTLTTWLASWVGSRRILAVRPVQATAASVESDDDSGRSMVARRIASIVLIAVGVLLLGGGVVIGMVSMLGVLVGMLGGILSFSGIVLAAPFVMPAVLRLVGRALGPSPTARLAAENAVRNPARSSRATIGLVIGVTLVTMFAVATSSYYDMIVRASEQYPEDFAGVDETLAITIGVFSVLFGFSAVIAAVGMVNTLSLSVLQRRRELGLLRALGFTAGQVRRMVLAEAVQMSVASVAFGVVLGIVYGWSGAQALLGSMLGGGFVGPSVPWFVIVGAVVVAVVLAAAASIAPAQRATRVSPVAALAVE
ncbi:ABC transporter permease [Labedella endophytica]|uniref:FtsX-like permease family protein n=1 Tax=Labedella endophytica TaxID=1523160 RepID=A0A3S0VQX8_9MICO|nr:ABC transporter permease [Labedella endophytica]RUQ97138.1 FtsX-like permease family protein [Labedella endophytica]